MLTPTLPTSGFAPAHAAPTVATGATPASVRPLAALLLAAIVSALLVAADALIDTYADGHLLLAWSILWAIGFAAMALFADSARQAARRLLASASTWRARREAQAADATLWALAQRDPRIMADLQAAMERARAERCETELAHGRAWVAHHPVGTLNAAYTGPRRMYRSAPMTGLPMHQCMYPAG